MAKIEDRAAAPMVGINDDIGEDKRLALFRTQVLLRDAEQPHRAEHRDFIRFAVASTARPCEVRGKAATRLKPSPVRRR